MRWNEADINIDEILDRKQEVMVKQITYFDSSLLSNAKRNVTHLIFQKRIAVNQVFIPRT